MELQNLVFAQICRCCNITEEHSHALCTGHLKTKRTYVTVSLPVMCWSNYYMMVLTFPVSLDGKPNPLYSFSVSTSIQLRNNTMWYLADWVSSLDTISKLFLCYFHSVQFSIGLSNKFSAWGVLISGRNLWVMLALFMPSSVYSCQTNGTCTSVTSVSAILYNNLRTCIIARLLTYFRLLEWKYADHNWIDTSLTKSFNGWHPTAIAMICVMHTKYGSSL